jgi:energy-coupling factor transporter ATP-binding protein EcfA2
MIQLPILTYLRIEKYGLFPGAPAGKGIEWAFTKGLCLVAGINGLGKTTLITMLLRIFTGPYDLTAEGLPERLESVVPERPVVLKPGNIRFFAQRVADQAANALVLVRARFGSDELEISRRLSDLRLLSFGVNGKSIDLGANREEREAAFQQQICYYFDVSSFVDVLLVLHHVVFFKEDRPGALWDENAQRHVLRALFLEKDLAAQVATAERRVQSADSQARNISASAYTIEQKLQQARASQENASEKSLQLAAEQTLLDAELKESERLDTLIAQLDERRKDARREFERAKLFREEAESAVESLKFAALARLFPTMEDAARLVVLKALTTGECLVCGADTQARLEEVEAQLAKGICPTCGAEPEQQDHVVPGFKVEEKRVKRARETAQLAVKEEEASRINYEETAAEYGSVLDRLATVRASIQERTLRARQLSAELPFEAGDILHLQKSLELTRRSQRQAESNRASAAKVLGALLERGRGVIEKQTKKLAMTFKEKVKAMVAEDAELVGITGQARLTQGKETFAVPAFRAQMTAADRPGKTLRNSPDDVSESQRELIDLAFRLALIDIATGGKACTLTMETPEASLDELAMERVGMALHGFATHGDNRLIVTSNLTNAGMITAMFGGRAKNAAEVSRRREHVVNLLDVAAPNQAVLTSRAQYQRILTSALTGK